MKTSILMILVLCTPLVVSAAGGPKTFPDNERIPVLGSDLNRMLDDNDRLRNRVLELTKENASLKKTLEDAANTIHQCMQVITAMDEKLKERKNYVCS